MSSKSQATVAVVAILSVLAFLVSLTYYLSEKSVIKNEREQITIQKCLERGNSPLECRFAIKGNVNR